jgi:hypothetical protein
MGAADVDGSAGRAYAAAGLDFHELFTLIFGGDQSATMIAAEHLAAVTETRR